MVDDDVLVTKIFTSLIRVAFFIGITAVGISRLMKTESLSQCVPYVINGISQSIYVQGSVGGRGCATTARISTIQDVLESSMKNGNERGSVRSSVVEASMTVHTIIGR